MSRPWKKEIEIAVLAEDHGTILGIARDHAPRVIRFLNSQLYRGDPEVKWKAVRALGAVAGDAGILDHQRTTDLLRRFVWALNDESGAVPFGVPEAIGEILAVRPEFQPAFLPILCSLLTEDEMIQTGPIEQGALWGVGRVGRPAGDYSKTVVSTVRLASESHPDPETRKIAAASLQAIAGDNAE